MKSYKLDTWIIPFSRLSNVWAALPSHFTPILTFPCLYLRDWKRYQKMLNIHVGGATGNVHFKPVWSWCWVGNLTHVCTFQRPCMLQERIRKTIRREVVDKRADTLATDLHWRLVLKLLVPRFEAWCHVSPSISQLSYMGSKSLSITNTGSV